VARKMYPAANTNYGVVSTLTYGVQWDSIVQWLKDKGVDILNSQDYGNYYDNAISTFNEGASVSTDHGQTYTAIDSSYSKTSSQSHLLTTGATEETRVNNIYDMAGNLLEWTMEGYSVYYRVLRGGSFDSVSSSYPVSSRYYFSPDRTNCGYGFHPALYIKK